MSNFLVIGHRGCAGVLAENTLVSVRAAVDSGCEMVEVDVWLCEGRLMVIHDETVDRTTDGVGKVDEFLLSDLRELDAGGGERVPFLEEVLDICLGKCVVNVELKGPGTGKVLVNLLGDRDGVDSVVVSSFDWEMLREVRVLNEGVNIGVLVDKKELLGAAISMAAKLDAVSVNPWVKFLTKEVCQEIKGAGYECYVFTVRIEEELNKVLDCEAGGCFVDDPGWVLEVLR